MDDFGVLTQSMGIKPHGKAAPMAALKQSSVPFRQPPTKIQSFPNSPDVFDHVFGAPKPSNSTFNYDAADPFGGLPGLDNSESPHFDYVFGSFVGHPNQNRTSSDNDLFGTLGGDVSRNGSGGSAKASSAGFDNLIPGFRNPAAKTKGFNSNTNANQQANKPTVNQPDDPFIMLDSTSGNMSPYLLDQLGRLGTSRSTNLHHSSSNGSLYDNSDPFDIFNHADKAHSTRPASSSPPSSSPPPRPKKKTESVKSPSVSSIDDLEDFAMGRMQPNPIKKADVTKRKDRSHSPAAAFAAAWKEKKGSHVNGNRGAPHISRQKSEDADFLSGMGSDSRTNKNRVAEDAASQRNSHKSADDHEYIFGASRSNSAPRSRTTNLNTAFDNLFSNGANHVGNVTTGTPSSSKNDSNDDFSSLFGPGLAGKFKDIDGEPKERTKARLASHYRIQERMTQAVADMKERDLQLQQEQEERQRIADSVDADIKRWVVGKEGNLRALLSSMQYVLWADCGWQPVSLTDLITSSSVKKVYKKATLCVHPDKVQQRGANLQQKYAEKVFDILKEAHTKFNASEQL